MLHLIQGTAHSHGDRVVIQSQNIGVECLYKGLTREGTFILYPYFDERNKTFFYFAFDSYEQKQLFESLLKISGVGIKTAFHVSWTDKGVLDEAIQSMDPAALQKLPGVGAKTAKRLLIELKDQVKSMDINKLFSNDSVLKDISATLGKLGFTQSVVKNKLKDCTIPATKENIGEIIHRLLVELSTS